MLLLIAIPVMFAIVANVAGLIMTGRAIDIRKKTIISTAMVLLNMIVVTITLVAELVAIT